MKKLLIIILILFTCSCRNPSSLENLNIVNRYICYTYMGKISDFTISKGSFLCSDTYMVTLNHTNKISINQNLSGISIINAFVYKYINGGFIITDISPKEMYRISN